MKLNKETVYINVDYDDIVNGKVKIDEIEYITKDLILSKENLFAFTSEQLNEYTSNVIKQALETAVYRAIAKEDPSDFGTGEIWVDEKSITNTFEETFKKFKV